MKGVTTGWASGEYDELIVTVAVNSCKVLNQLGVEWTFSQPPLITVSISPYRMVIPLNDKHALITAGSYVEMRITGESADKLKAVVMKVEERKARLLSDFAAVLQTSSAKG